MKAQAQAWRCSQRWWTRARIPNWWPCISADPGEAGVQLARKCVRLRQTAWVQSKVHQFAPADSSAVPLYTGGMAALHLLLELAASAWWLTCLLPWGRLVTLPAGECGAA